MKVRIRRYSTSKVKLAISKAEPIEAEIGSGLKEEQVEARLKDGLGNKAKKQVNKTYLKIILDNFFNFFNIILYLILILMLTAGIRTVTSYFFVIILAANSLIGLLSDIRARVLIDRLRLVTDPKAKVIRDGKKAEIAVDQVVLDDIIYLDAGDQIPCDCELLDGRLYVDESLITGESDPVEKTKGSQIYGASYVKSGHAHVRATKVGAASYSESLRSSATEFRRPKSEIKKSTFSIFLITGIIAVILGAAALVDYFIPVWTGDGTLGNYPAFISALSGMMVAMIPTGLYLLTSMTLAVGVIALAKKRMNVQELYCIEMLARVDTVCFDKTGTLTEGHLDVDDLIPLGKATKGEIGSIAYSLAMATGDNNATAEAILRIGEGLTPLPHGEAVPFDSSRKYSAADLKKAGVYALGAYGYIHSKPNAAVSSRINRLTEAGKRVLVLFKVRKIKNGEVVGDGEPVGLVVLRNAIKKDAKENIAWFVNNGVAVKVISGDDPLTVARIAREVGVPNASKAISLAGMPVEQVGDLVDRYAVFGRVSPEQKAALVEALQQRGRKVAMTGDGVNDILALKKADCSIAMASGSMAARNVSHLISMDNDFGHLPDVVAEGRRVINNLQRTASLFLVKTIFAIVLGFVFQILAWMGKGVYPFTTQNMLLWEILAIGVPAFFLSLQPTKERLRGSFIKNVMAKALPAAIGAILCVGVIYLSHYINPNFIDGETARTLSVLSFSLFSYFALFNVCLPLSKYRLFVFGSMAVLGLAVLGLDIYTAYEMNGTGIGAFLGIDYGGTGFTAGAVLLAVISTLMLAGGFILFESLYERSRKKKGDAA